MISVDDHILEPSGIWQDRLPARYLEAGPRVVVKDGTEYWRYEGRLFPTSGLSAVAGKKYDDITPHALSYADMRPGCYESAWVVRWTSGTRTRHTLPSRSTWVW